MTKTNKHYGLCAIMKASYGEVICDMLQGHKIEYFAISMVFNNS
jgi:hypothetical protein